jgi:hypothetical protein
MLLQSAVSFGINMLNGTITATPTDSNTSLTIAIKTLAGNDPSASDPVWFVFRNATIGSGVPGVITVTAALNTKITAGSTLGSSNATPFRFWIAAVNSAGVVSLAVINCLSGTNIFGLAGWGINNITAYGGGANSAQVFYGAGTIGSVPYSVLGYGSYEAGSTLATAGTYATAPTRLELYRPGVPLPGAEIQALVNESGSLNSGTTAYTGGDTAPTASQGNSYLTQVITPASSANVLEVEMQLMGAPSANGITIVSLQQDSTVGALAALYVDATSNATGVGRILHRLLAATLSSTTFKAFAGGTGAVTWTFNGTSGAPGTRLLGGTMNSFIKVREIVA